MSSVPNLVGIVIVDHGSKVEAANDQLNAVVEVFRRETGAHIVEPAHMELVPPTIADAVAACVKQGATEVIVHPYFLAPGRHSTEDIPRLAREAAAQQQIPVRVTEPLGLDPRMCAVIADRIAEALDSSSVG